MGATVLAGSEVGGLLPGGEPRGESGSAREAGDAPGASQRADFGQILAGATPSQERASQPREPSHDPSAREADGAVASQSGAAVDRRDVAQASKGKPHAEKGVAGSSEARGTREGTDQSGTEVSQRALLRKGRGELVDSSKQVQKSASRFSSKEETRAAVRRDPARSGDEVGHDASRWDPRDPSREASQDLSLGDQRDPSRGASPDLPSGDPRNVSGLDPRDMVSRAPTLKDATASKANGSRVDRQEMEVDEERSTRHDIVGQDAKSEEGSGMTPGASIGVAKKSGADSRGASLGSERASASEKSPREATGIKSPSLSERISRSRRSSASRALLPKQGKAVPTLRVAGPRETPQRQVSNLSRQIGGVNGVRQAASNPSVERGSETQASTGESLLFQVGSAVQGMRVAGDGTYLLSLRLEPPELGVVRVTVALHDGEVVSVRLAPVEGATHELLSDLLGDLKQDLARQQAGNVLVELAGGSQDGGSSRGAQSRQQDLRLHFTEQRNREGSVGSSEPQGASGSNSAVSSGGNPLGTNGRGLWVDLRL